MKRFLILIQIFVATTAVFAQQPVDYLIKAKALIRSGKTDDAIFLLSEGLTKYQDSRLFIARAGAYLKDNNYPDAINDYVSANKITLYSGDYGLSQIYSLKGDVTSALFHLEKNLNSVFKKSEKEIMLDTAFSHIENRPEWRQFWKKERYDIFERKITELEYYISTANSEEANIVLYELTNNYPENSSTLYAKALANMALHNYNETINILLKLSHADKKNENYIRLLAKAQTASGNYPGASVSYGELIGMGIADADLFLFRAQCYNKTGENEKALKDLSKFLELYPENKTALSLAGKIEAESGDNLKALDYFSKNLKLHPNDPDCFIDRANGYFASKTWEYAIRDYSMALDIKPDNPEVWFNKGIALLNSGKNDDACYDFRKALGTGNKKAAGYISRYCIK